MYSNWLTDGIYARYLVNADKSFITGLLDESGEEPRRRGAETVTRRYVSKEPAAGQWTCTGKSTPGKEESIRLAEQASDR